MHSCSPIALPDDDTATTVSSSEPGYGDANFTMVTLNAVDVFTPSGISPIPTDIQLAPCNDDPIGDEFHTFDAQSKLFDHDNPIFLNCLSPDELSNP